MAYLIREYPSNFYLIDRLNSYQGKKLNAWRPEIEKAIIFENIEEALEIINEIMKDPKRTFEYKIINTEYEF